jgi:glutamyl-tRNA synthetase
MPRIASDCSGAARAVCDAPRVRSPDGRFAPSPSGPLHIGNLRTALLAWLFARSQQARFVLRIEDLDPVRSRRDYEEQALTDLQRLGVDWDPALTRGAQAGRGPVRQSERRERHRQVLEELRAAGRVYPCWCTRAEVRLAAAAPHGADRGGAYPGTCRKLSASERRSREASGRPSAWRLDARGARVGFNDRIHGARSADVDDFVLWRGDDVPAYNLAVVVDDADERIGEVVRGADLLETTPRQVLLAELLGFPQPRYVHVPLVLGHDGKRLAKRHTEMTLDLRVGRGEAIEGLVGWMASSAGLAEPGARLSALELLARFDPRRLRSEPARVDAAGRLNAA